MNEIKEVNPLIKEIRCRGLMIAIELTKYADLIRKQLLKQGFILVKRSGVEVLRMDPALTINEQDIDSFLETFEQIIQDIENE